MKEIQYSKHSFEWWKERGTKLTVLTAVTIWGAVLLTGTLFLKFGYADLGLVVLIPIGLIVYPFIAILMMFCVIYDVFYSKQCYEEYKYNLIRKIKVRCDRKYRKWLM